MSSEFFQSLEMIEEEKGISRDIVLDALESALISAYKKHFGAVSDIGVVFDEESGAIRIIARKTVVEEVEERETQICLDEAKRINEKYDIGDIVEMEVTPASFGRIAAQTARQVVLQRIHEAEREKMVNEYSDRENDIATGVVERLKNAMLCLKSRTQNPYLCPTNRFVLTATRLASATRYSLLRLQIRLRAYILLYRVHIRDLYADSLNSRFPKSVRELSRLRHFRVRRAQEVRLRFIQPTKISTPSEPVSVRRV